MAYSQLSYDPWETTPEERKARFVGREALLQQLLSAIAEQQEHKTIQHYLLLGPRGIGKTTLLLTLRERIREDPALSARWFCVQLREEEYFIRTLRDLLELTLRALAEDEGLPEAAELARRVHQEPKEERSLAAAVDGLRSLASSHGKRILLLMDNFDRVFPATATGRGKKRPPENEFRSFRKLLSTESFLMVVGASVRLFQEIAAYDRAFFNFFSPMEIPDLSEDEICQLLRRCAEAEGNTTFLAQFDALRNKVRAITFMTGGNPRLVLMLYDVLRHRELTPVVQALRETVGGLTPLLKHVLDDMPRQQSKTLDALVRLRGAASPNQIAEMARLRLNVVTVQLGRLKESRFVVAEGDGKGKPATYRISDPMFQTWYQMRYLRPAGRRVELFVEFIRAWFSVEERRQFLNERWRALGNGGKRTWAFQEAGLAIQYYAAALEDEQEKRRHFERLADVFSEVGRERDAAMLLAECNDSEALTGRFYESFAYRRLGDRTLQKGDAAKAIAAYRRALDKDPGDRGAALGLGVCLLAGSGAVEAVAVLGRIVEAPRASAAEVAMARVHRSFAKEKIGDKLGALADLNAAIELPDIPNKLTALLLVTRGIMRGALGDKDGAIADLMTVEVPDLEPSLAVAVLLSRGDAKQSTGDKEGAIVDYTAALELPRVLPEEVAIARLRRGTTKLARGDSQGAIADLTALVDLPGAPVEQIPKGLVSRGGALAKLGDFDRALRDFQLALEIPAIGREWRALALQGCGVTLFRLGKMAEAAAALEQAVELQGGTDAVYVTFAGLITAHLANNQPQEAARWVSRLHEFEPAERPVDKRLEARINAIMAGGSKHGLETANLLLDAALRGGSEDIRARLEFLAPAIQYAKTGDEQTLARLPEREREAAKQIAAALLEKGDGAVSGP